MTRKSGFAEAHADLAELTVSSKGFRRADGMPYADEDAHLSSDEVEAHMAARGEAKSIIFEALAEAPHDARLEQFWEMQRKATLAKLGGNALGSFNDFFLRLPSESRPTIYERDDLLPEGEPEVVHTNTQISRMKKHTDDPIDFMDQALGYVRQRETTRREAVGPENFATSLKYFADMYAEIEDNDDIDTDRMKRLVKQNLDGFFKVAQKDPPNYIEMTNVYSAIRMLPAGMIDPKHVKPLLEQTARLLPEYTVKVANTFFRALPKLDLGENGEAAAELVNLSVRKNMHFETTSDLRDAIRAVAVLPKGFATDRALSAVFTYRNNLEASLDIEGADELMYRLRGIADSVVGSNDLYVELKKVAAGVGNAAISRYKDNHREGVYTKEQAKEVLAVMERIKTNFHSI